MSSIFPETEKKTEETQISIEPATSKEQNESLTLLPKGKPSIVQKGLYFACNLCLSFILTFLTIAVFATFVIFIAEFWKATMIPKWLYASLALSGFLPVYFVVVGLSFIYLHRRFKCNKKRVVLHCVYIVFTIVVIFLFVWFIPKLTNKN